MATLRYLMLLVAGLLVMACCDGKKLMATDSQQTIETPGYSYWINYQSNMFETWTIETEDNKHIVEVQISMGIQSCWDCYCDNLHIYDGTSRAATSLGKFCGTSTDNFVSSTGRDMYVVFQSDSNNEDRGFKLTYRQVPDDSDIDAWMIVGIVLSVVIVIAIIGIITFCWCQHKAKDQVTPIPAAEINNRRQNEPRVWMTPVQQQQFQAVPDQILPTPAYRQVPRQYPQAFEMQDMYNGNLPGSANVAGAELPALQQQSPVKS